MQTTIKGVQNMAFAIMRLEKVKTISAMTNRQNHNTRKKGATITDEQPMKPISLMEDRGISYSEFFKEKTKGMKIRKDAVRGLECVMTFSPNGVRVQDLQQWATDCKKWLFRTFGADNIYSCQIHLSEKTPHIHALIIPIRDNKLNAKAIVGNKSNLSKLQDDYAKCVQKYGLERGIDKKITKAHHQSSMRWHSQNARKEDELKEFSIYKKMYGRPEDWDEVRRQKFYTLKGLENDAQDFDRLKEDIFR